MTPTVITDSDSLAAAAARLASAPRLALDTEFLRERTYVAELALVQLAAGAQVELVDPLAGISLAPLVELLRAPTPLKVLHAARQDVEVLLPLTGVPLSPLFDTQIAAALLGMPAQIGYADLVARELGATLDKSQVRSDWTRRPLSAAQLEYASADVRWLLPLAEQLEARLAARGRRAWLEQDCAALGDPELYRQDPRDAWRRFKGRETLAPAEQQRLQALAEWREQRAQRRNLPRGWVLADEAVRSLARAPPASEAALRAQGVLPAGAVVALAPELLSVLAAAGARPPEGLVRREDARPGPEEQARSRRLGERLKSLAAELELAPEVLATQRDLRRLARGDAVPQVFAGWRLEVLGAALGAELARG